MNRKGTLNARQGKDNVRVKILFNSSYFMVYTSVYQIWTNVYGLLCCIGYDLRFCSIGDLKNRKRLISISFANL